MKLYKFSFLLGIILVTLFSCTSDDNTTTTNGVGTGYYIYKGIEHPLKAGTIQNYGNWAGKTTEYVLELYTTDLSIDTNGKIILDDDIFDLLNFELNSKNISKPNTGRYNYSEDKYFDYSCSEFHVLIDTEALSYGYVPEERIYVNSGWINVLKSGAVYEIEFEFFKLFGESITGYYKGKLSEL